MLEGVVGKFKSFYSRNYKKLMIVPVLFFIFSVLVLGGHKLAYGEFVSKDIDLKGGTIGTVIWNYTDRPDVQLLESAVRQDAGAEVTAREIYTYGQTQLLALSFEAGPEVDAEKLKTSVLSAINAQGFSPGEYSSKTVGAAMGEAFLKMSINSLIIGFLLMGFVTFITFRTPIIVFTIIGCAILNALGATAVMALLGIKLSPATVAALLMILGYSDDANVLITTAVLKKTEGSTMSRAYAAIKTGATMIAATFAALLMLWFVSNSQVLEDIALVLMAGLAFDIANTWFTNLGILLWYKEKKEAIKRVVV